MKEEIFVGNLSFGDLVRDYGREIYLLRRRENKGSLLEIREASELDELQAKRKKATGPNSPSYKENFTPEQHKILQGLEAEVHKLTDKPTDNHS